MLYIWIYSFVFSAHIQFATQRQQQYQDYETYISCLISVFLYFYFYLFYFYRLSFFHYEQYGGLVQCELPQTVNFTLWIIASFNVAAGGFFVFLIFGTSKGVLDAWGGTILCIATRGAVRSIFKNSGSSTDSGREGVRVVGITANTASSSGKSDLSSTYYHEEEEEVEEEEDDPDDDDYTDSPRSYTETSDIKSVKEEGQTKEEESKKKEENEDASSILELDEFI